MANYNKAIEQLVRTSWETHALQGFWKKANFEKTDHGCSFMLYERVELEKPYYFIAHEWLKKHVDPAGIYTKKRSEKLFAPLAAMLQQSPWSENDLRIGQKVWLLPIREISTKYRRGEIGEIDMLESDSIVDLINCAEEYGYSDSYGSCYSLEIVIVKDADGNWHPFEAKKEATKDE